MRPFDLRWIATVLCAAGALAGPPARAARADDARRWPDERTAGPFVCHADFPLADHQRLMAEMAQLQRDLSELLHVGPPRERIHLFLFAEKSTYQAYLGRYFAGLPDRRALFVKGRGPGMVFAYRNRDFEIDVRHEGTHALLHASRGQVPLWLDEGLAEYFEAPPAERAYDNPHLRLVRWSTRVGRAPSIETLEAVESVDDMGRGEYRDSWAWVHFMLHGSDEAHEVLIGYLDDLAQGRATPSLGDRLKRRIPDLERRFLDHFRTWAP